MDVGNKKIEEILEPEKKSREENQLANTKTDLESKEWI